MLISPLKPTPSLSQGLANMTHFTPITLQDIWHAAITQDAKLWARDNLEYLNKPMRLFGTSVKVELGNAKRETSIMYLQPAGKVAVKTLCIGADSAGCERACLIQSGQLGMSTGQRAATKRTILMIVRPDWFEAQVLREVDKAERRAVRTGIPALFRLNGTSDCDFSAIIAQRPFSGFYDYTKVLSRIRKNTLSNYHLTFSGSMYSPSSRSALGKAVQAHMNIAVAFNTKGLESDDVYIPFGMASFDESDLRPLDVAGTLGALKRKGSNKAERALEGVDSFFVTASNIADFRNIIAVG